MPESRCRKCRRLLKAASSIALGMGPKSGGRGKPAGTKVQHKSGNPYSSSQISEKAMTMTVPMFREDEDIAIYLRAVSEPIPLDDLLKLTRTSKSRKLIRRLRCERYEKRMPLAPGMYTRPDRTPIFYEPVGDREWRCSTSEHLVTHHHLGIYLRRWGRI